MRIPISCALLALALPCATHAQLLPEQFGDSERLYTGQRVSVFEPSVRSRAAGNQWVGPWAAFLSSDPARPALSLYSVDFAHYVYPASEWVVNVTGLGDGEDLSRTRLAADTRPLGALERYRQAAYLASRLRVAPTSQWAGIHAAIWQITTPEFSTLVAERRGDFDALTGDPGDPGGMSYWLTQAEAESSSGFANTNLDEWRILTDTRSVGFRGGQPEVLTRVVSVPEPETWALLIPGLLILGFFGRRRRAKGSGLA
jgi:hypothetical protein